MLPNHAPLVIAEQFGTLEALAPGRIDLGLGRAPGTDGATAAALRRTRPPARGRRRLPAAARRADPLPRRRLPRRPPATPASTPSPARCRATSPGGVQSPAGRRSGCSAPPASARAWPARSACPSPSRTTSRRRTPSRRSTCTASPSGPRRSWTPRTPSIGVSALAADDRERGPPPGADRRAEHAPAAHRPARAGPDARGGGGVRVQPDGAGVRRLLDSPTSSTAPRTRSAPAWTTSRSAPAPTS